METPIATKLCEARTRSWLALVTATSVLIGDFALCWWTPGYQWYRFVLPGVGAIVLFWLCRWDPRALGLVLRPVQGYRYWAKAGLAIGGLVLGFSIFVFATARVVGYSLPLPTLSPKKAVFFALIGCVHAPLVEEVLYRLVLCVPLVALAGPRSAIVAGGIVFAALHFVYGNTAPDNFIAGFFLCWAYMKSGSLIVPMLFHCVGNSFVVVAQLTNWYWMQ